MALRIHLVSCENADLKPTHDVEGVVGVPRLPRSRSELQFAGGVLMRETSAPRHTRYTVTQWDDIKGSHSVVVERHRPLGRITDNELVGPVKITNTRAVGSLFSTRKS